MGDVYTNPPQSRNEAILESIVEGTEYTDPPQSRIEDLLLDVKEVIEQGGGGTTVVANPEGTATDDLSKLQVGQTIYAIPEGTEVEANPQDSASETLTKLKVDDTIYSVPNGGGGGGTSDYTELTNKPEINGNTLSGNKTGAQLGLVDAEDGKGLSENDFTDALKTKLDNIEAGAEVNVQADWTEADNTADDFIKNKPNLATVATSGSYDDLSNKPSIPAAQVQADWSEADDSAVDFIKNKPNLATVATSGSYNDLSNKPTIPAAQVNADWNASSGVAEILNKPNIPAAQVNSDWNASSGVAEILNKPTIPDAVVANPSENATENLSKLKIGNTVYGIEKGTTIVQIPSVVGSSFTYDGTAQGPTITGLDSVHCTITGDTSATNAGSYTFTIALSDPSSMVWSDLTTADKTYSFTIAKASQTISASPSTVSLGTNTQTANVTISGASTALSATSSDTGIATVSGTSSPITITAVANGSATISVQAASSSNYEASNTLSINVAVLFKPDLVAWSSGTDAQITAMIDGYYSGTLTLNEIKSVWSVGDVRNVNISAISAGGGSGDTAWSVGESHQAQTIRLEIIDFEHDTLKSPINGKTKALITVDMKDCFNYTNYVNNGNNNTENGYINSSASKDWSTCERRQWCKNAFVNALPTYLKDIVKTVSKPTRENGDSNTEINLDETAFLLSCKELADYGSLEGTQYAYYANATANQYKLPRADNQGNTVCCVVWTKTSYNSGFQFMNRIGNIDGTAATLARGLFVGFCL